jgi:hypothetical protein
MGKSRDMKRNNIVASLLLIAFAGFYGYLTANLPSRNLPNTLEIDFMPWLLVSLLFVLSLWILFQAFFGETKEAYDPIVSKKDAFGVVCLTILVYLYVKGIQFFGFLAVTPVFTATLMWIAGARKWKEILFVSVGTSFCVYLFFQKVFRVILPGGTIF